MSENYTDEQKALVMAYMRSKSWRMNHLYKIKTKEKQLIQYKRKLAQEHYASVKGNKNMILKARQLGFTTECLIDMLDDTITHANTNSAIVAHEKDKVVKMFEIVKRAYDNMPDLILDGHNFKATVSLDNRNEMYFPELDSKIYVTMDTRSETVHNLHVSEAHFIRNAEEMLAGTLESVPKDGKITLESTGNGLGGYFYEEWEDPNSEFKKHFYNWLWDKDYYESSPKSMEELEAEYRSLSMRYGTIEDIVQRFNLTKEQFVWYIAKVRRHKELVVQEYPITSLEAFLATGRNVFHLTDLQKHVTFNPIERKWSDLLIWEKPLKGFKYVIGVDPAEGRGGDNSVIEVFNAHTGVQAAEFASNYTPPNKLADMAIEIGNMYNKAFIVVEANNHGHAVIQSMRTRYWNMYRRETIDKITKEKVQILGWSTNGTTKPLLVDNLEESTREQSIAINSEELLKEMKVFVQTDEPGKKGYGAAGTAKDDRVIATGLCVQGIKEIPRQKRPEAPAMKKMREYAEKHGLPTNFQTADDDPSTAQFPPDMPRPSQIINHHNRPNVGMRRN